jgi:hypothetical protein
MKYDVIKDVIVDGVGYCAGSTVEIHHDLVGRFILLGYLAVQMAPKKRTKRSGVDNFELSGD